ncbi:MAG: DUF1080 domain-containing protein [Bacteroidota bacterium]|nr:DUF1080 domain-containing protein [Bacteroidota bacterium]
MKCNLMLVAALVGLTAVVQGQTSIRQANSSFSNPENAEVFNPVPPVVVPGETFASPPSDATMLFNGKDLNEWVSAEDQSPAKWTISNGIMTVNKAAGDIETKRKFTSYQLHIEWRIPAAITGQGQSRGNSGVFLSGRYEIQVLDTYNNENKTYVNGMAGSIYREAIPLSNPERKPGEWNVYDIAYTDPQFNDDGTLKSPARVSVFFNGVLVQNNEAIKGSTSVNAKHVYVQHGPAPLRLQAHGDKSAPISFRNIWIRG